VTVKVFGDMAHCQIAITDVSDEAAIPWGNWFHRRLRSSWHDVSYLSRPWSGLAYSQQP